MKEYKSRKEMFKLGYPTRILEGDDVDGFNKALETVLKYVDIADYRLTLDADSIGTYGVNGAVVSVMTKGSYPEETITIFGIKGRGNLLFKMLQLPETSTPDWY